MDVGYVVIEAQTNADGTVGTLVTAYTDRLQAESAYHSVLASAAISALPRHSATLLTTEGTYVDSRCYDHPLT